MLVGGVCWLGMTEPAWAQTICVSGTANIFGAGHSAAPNSGGGTGGTLPPVMNVTGGSLLTIPAAILCGSRCPCPWISRALELRE